MHYRPKRILTRHAAYLRMAGALGCANAAVSGGAWKLTQLAPAKTRSD